jgi:acyl-CoA synthetase (NDP forming)
MARETRPKIPIVISFMGTFGVSKVLAGEGVHIPSYPVPRTAVQALSRAVAYGRWHAKPLGATPAFPEARVSEAKELVGSAARSGHGWLDPEEANLLLDCYGIPTVKTLRAASVDEAGEMASSLGGKVVIKGLAEGLIHKSDAGAVKTGLTGETEVRAAAREMTNRLAAAGQNVKGFLVQPMMPSGPEMIVGVTNDPSFGPIVVCGAGGVLVELLKDVSIRIAPLTEEDAREMVSSLKTYPLLTGYRGGPQYDAKSLESAILRVAALARDLPEVAELDLNPVILQPAGRPATVVDARVRLEAPKRAV